jgi:hypothetical protein
MNIFLVIVLLFLFLLINKKEYLSYTINQKYCKYCKLKNLKDCLNCECKICVKNGKGKCISSSKEYDCDKIISGFSLSDLWMEGLMEKQNEIHNNILKKNNLLN